MIHPFGTSSRPFTTGCSSASPRRARSRRCTSFHTIARRRCSQWIATPRTRMPTDGRRTCDPRPHGASAVAASIDGPHTRGHGLPSPCDTGLGAHTRERLPHRRSLLGTCEQAGRGRRRQSRHAARQCVPGAVAERSAPAKCCRGARVAAPRGGHAAAVSHLARRIIPVGPRHDLDACKAHADCHFVSALRASHGAASTLPAGRPARARRRELVYSTYLRSSYCLMPRGDNPDRAPASSTRSSAAASRSSPTTTPMACTTLGISTRAPPPFSSSTVGRPGRASPRGCTTRRRRAGL